MLRIERRPGVLILVSRLARPRVLAVVAGALAALALACAGPAPGAGIALALAAGLVVFLGGRAVRARFEGGRVAVYPAVPLRHAERRALADFASARLETFAEARRRKAERLARGFEARSGAEMPAWLRAPDVAGPNDPLRRVVLVARAGEPFPVTAWLAEDDLEPARAAVEATLA